MPIDVNSLSEQEAKNALAIAMQRIEQMKQDSQRKLSIKVSEKGAVSVYGLGRFPVTLYASQWEQFIPFVKSGTVERFMAANADKLSHKE